MCLLQQYLWPQIGFLISLAKRQLVPSNEHCSKFSNISLLIPYDILPKCFLLISPVHNCVWFHFVQLIMRFPSYFPDFQAPNPCSTSKTNTQVFFPHPNDNTKFIQCNAVGEMYIIQCPHGKLYNKATVSCVSQVRKLNVNARQFFHSKHH